MAEQRYEKAVQALKDHDEVVNIFIAICLGFPCLLILFAIGRSIFG